MLGFEVLPVQLQMLDEGAEDKGFVATPAHDVPVFQHIVELTALFLIIVHGQFGVVGQLPELGQGLEHLESEFGVVGLEVVQ